ncbi:hypothetical protein C8Q76DRAFT_785154 [Earliella scabrosa]|nr:hypothetical protein C8Q76DRAFT_785154 [Earliella scabrosa]
MAAPAPLGLFTSQAAKQCQNRNCRTPKGHPLGILQFMHSATPGTSGKYLCEACYAYYEAKSKSAGSALYNTLSTGSAMRPSKAVIGKDVAAAQRGHGGGEVVAHGLDALQQLQQKVPVHVLQSYGYSAAHSRYQDVRKALQTAAYAGGSAAAQLVTVKADMVTLKPGKRSRLQVGTVCEAIANVPARIGQAALKYLVFCSVYPLFLQWSNHYSGLSYQQCTLRRRDWVNIGEPADPDNDHDAIAQLCFVEAKGRGPNKGRVFKPPRDGVSVFLEIPYDVYEAAMEHAAVDGGDDSGNEYKDHHLRKSDQNAHDRSKEDKRKSGRLGQMHKTQTPTIPDPSAVGETERILDAEPLEAVLGVKSAKGKKKRTRRSDSSQSEEENQGVEIHASKRPEPKRHRGLQMRSEPLRMPPLHQLSISREHFAEALSQQRRPSKPAAMALLHSMDIAVVVQVCPQRSVLDLIEPGQAMRGAFKETRFAICSPNPDGQGGRIFMPQLYQSAEQIQYLSQEIVCLQWADALMRLVYDFVALQKDKTKYPIPALHFVRAGLALEADVISSERRVFMIEERIEQGTWVKYINNNSPTPLAPATATVELQHISDFLVFCQHFQFVHTGGSAFVSDFQGSMTLLTDPQIITNPELGSNLFSTGNLSRAFEEFPQKHTCSKFCKYYELEGLDTAHGQAELTGERKEEGGDLHGDHAIHAKKLMFVDDEF